MRSLAYARIAVGTDRWLDIAVDGWQAIERCDSLVRQQLDHFGLAPDHLARTCGSDALPSLSAYQLVMSTERKAFLTPPIAMYSIETLVPFETGAACEMRKAQLVTDEAKAFEQRGIERRRAMGERIAAVKRSCDEARAGGIPHDLSCMCEVVQVPSPTFKPTPRECRARHGSLSGPNRSQLRSQGSSSIASMSPAARVSHN